MSYFSTYSLDVYNFTSIKAVEVGERDDEAAAAEAWANYLQRDRSVIVDQFQGQLKSTVRCK